jgi:uncharacterized DUF497 family protein
METTILDVSWHQEKARRNFVKHGVSFKQAATVLLDPMSLTLFDMYNSMSEERWFTLGTSSEGRILAVSHTHRIAATGRIKIRIISARAASRREISQYINRY